VWELTNEEFTGLMQQYQKLIYTVCLQFVHEPHTAEDLTQDTFLSAFSAIDRCEPQYYKQWLVRVAANKCKDHLKSAWVRKVDAPGDDALPEPRGAPGSDADDPAMLREELGDVLMQVAFHAVIEEERGHFTFEDVCREVCEKLVFRHPNIFASSAAENAGINSWDALKNKEKGRTTLADELNTVPATLPALMYAQKMQKRAARKGAFAQTAEDAAAALTAAERGWEEAVPENAAERAGALLFAAANAMRLAGVDAEEALTFASGRFRLELLQKTEDSDGQERPATV